MERIALRTWCRAHPLAAYFCLVFVAAWLVWLPMVASVRGLIGVRFPPLTLWLAGVAPIGAATLVEWLAGGREEVGRLYGRFAVRGVSVRWYIAAAGLPVCFGLLTVGLRLLSAGQALPLSALPLAALALGKGLLYAPVAVFEEVGWRGCALPRLQARLPALASSLVLGLVWAAWHLPLWWLGAFGYGGMDPLLWAIDVLSVSTVITWLYNNGCGSLWLPCLFHGVANMTAQTLIWPLVGDAGPIVEALAALLVVAVYGPANLSRLWPRVAVESGAPAQR